MTWYIRGCCQKGLRCQYKHQVPTEDDELRMSMLKDIFGRTRHGSDRDDMVRGAFMFCLLAVQFPAA